MHAKEKARILYHGFDTAERPVIFLHFGDHQTTFEYFWASIAAGFLPAAFVNDPGKRKTIYCISVERSNSP